MSKLYSKSQLKNTVVSIYTLQDKCKLSFTINISVVWVVIKTRWYNSHSEFLFSSEIHQPRPYNLISNLCALFALFLYISIHKRSWFKFLLFFLPFLYLKKQKISLFDVYLPRHHLFTNIPRANCLFCKVSIRFSIFDWVGRVEFPKPVTNTYP